MHTGDGTILVGGNMAMKRIIAYYMNDAESDAAHTAMPDGESTDSYVFGQIDETAIDGLSAQGLIIQEMPDTAPPSLGVLSPALMAAAHGEVQFAPEFDFTRNSIYTIQLAGPLLAAWRQQFAALGVEIIEAIGPQLYTVALGPAQIGPVLNLPFVVSLHVHVESEQAPPIPESWSGPPVDTGADRIVTYDIRLKSPEDADTVLAHLASQEAIIVGARGRKIRIVVKHNSPLLADLRAMPEAYRLEEYVPPTLSNDRVRILLGIDAPGSGDATMSSIPFDGRGQIVGIADTGIDDHHPDFQGRLVGILALGRSGDHSDPIGHGTHVAGSVGGDGKASGGRIRGMAPAVGIFFQSIADAEGRLVGLPLDLNDLFDEAYQAGVRIHNNSWGAAGPSRYTFNSIEVDEFVDAHRDMTIVIAAGNEGTAREPFNAQPGFVDWLSLGSPATSKNAVTVGASQTDRTSGGYSNLTWAQFRPAWFPMPPIATEMISGDPESMAAFSSRGPCDDRRIKPDVLAPGTNIASTKSSRAPLAEFWGPLPGYNSQYAYMGGTSMATPIVTGCLALIRQYYVEEGHCEPSAALLKATLINSTRRLTGSSSVADFAALPNFHQGFGCVYMPWAVPNPGQPDLRLEFRDPWQDAGQMFTDTGQRLRYVITAGDARPLRFCLAYTDIPGRALQNDLNLFVQSLDTGQKWVGNQDRPMRLSPVDADNNVEIVRIDQPPPGEYLMQITATNLLTTTGQDFALVVTGDLHSGIKGW